MSQIGEELRLNRESKGISLREVENATNIRMKYLIALEAEDFDVLPGKVYIIGFLKTYASFLGMDDQEMVSRLKSQISSDPPSEEFKEQDKTRPKYKRKKTQPNLFIILIISALVIVGLIFAFSHDWGKKISNEGDFPIDNPQEEQQNPTNIPNNPEIPEIPETDPEININEPEISGVSVTVIIKESSCWIEVIIDGVPNFQGTLSEGENRTFIGQEIISIKYGNPRVVEVISNGESIYPVSNSGQVITKEYKEK